MSRRPLETTIESRLREARRIPPPPAPLEFRASLRARFVQGTIEAPGGLRRRSLAGPLALAAGVAAVAAIALALLDAGPPWRAGGAMGSGAVRLDGRPVAVESLRGRALRSGSTLEVPEGLQLDLELPGVALMQVAGGTRVTVPGSPGRIRREARCALESGEVRFATAPSFSGRLAVHTPEIRARVAGTTFAVIRTAEGSCVCVLEGRVAQVAGAASDTVRAGFRRTIFRDGRPPLLEPILPMETMKLGMLREAAAGLAPR